MIGFTALSEAAFWGYWALHVKDIRFSDRQAAVYSDLFAMLQTKDHFVLTSNVDAMFARHGFDPQRVCAVQGDYAYMQCLRPCTVSVWPSREPIERLLTNIDPVSEEATDASAIPRCPHCGGKVFLNVRAGSWFLDTTYRETLSRLNTWLGQQDDEPLLVFDIGSGFNTPSVVRWPMEQVTTQRPTARLVRINLDHPEVPDELSGRAVAIGADAGDVIRVVRQAL